MHDYTCCYCSASNIPHIHSAPQYEYFNAVLINEVDEEGNNVELGAEFLLEPNDHFNNLSVNLSLSVVQVPTNMYNKGEGPGSQRTGSRVGLFNHRSGGRKVRGERERDGGWGCISVTVWGKWSSGGIDSCPGWKRKHTIQRLQKESRGRRGRERCCSLGSCWVFSCCITQCVTSPCVSPRRLLFACNGLSISPCSQHKGRLIQQQEGRGWWSQALNLLFLCGWGVNEVQRSTVHCAGWSRMNTITTIITISLACLFSLLLLLLRSWHSERSLLVRGLESSVCW